MGKRRPHAAVVGARDRVLAFGCGPHHSLTPTHDSPVRVRRPGAARPALPSGKHARCFQEGRPGTARATGRSQDGSPPNPKGGDFVSELTRQRIAEAWVLIRKGGLSARIGTAFLKQHGVIE